MNDLDKLSDEYTKKIVDFDKTFRATHKVERFKLDWYLNSIDYKNFNYYLIFGINTLKNRKKLMIIQKERSESRRDDILLKDVINFNGKNRKIYLSKEFLNILNKDGQFLKIEVFTFFHLENDRNFQSSI